MSYEEAKLLLFVPLFCLQTVCLYVQMFSKVRAVMKRHSV